MIFLKRLFICSLFIFLQNVQAEEAAPAPVLPKSNPLAWDSVEIRQDLPFMTNLAYFEFWVTNTAPTNVTILSTETSCDCTVVEAKEKFPWEIAAGGSGPLNVRINIKGKYGMLTKTVIIHSTTGAQLLAMHMKIPISPAPFNVSVRQQDMMAAREDRQAVFKGHCAACHNFPTVGQTGETLFEKACGICHTSEHRAEMVPNLAELDRDKTADYWRNAIIHGRPGTLMPAFGKSEGGILDTNQIESLIPYLMKWFPSKKSDSSKIPKNTTNGDNGHAGS